MSDSENTNETRIVGPVAPGTDMRPRLLGVSLGVPILAGIGDDRDNIAVPCTKCSTPTSIVVHVYRHRRINEPTFHVKAACVKDTLGGRGFFVRVVRIIPGDWIRKPRLF